MLLIDELNNGQNVVRIQSYDIQSYEIQYPWVIIYMKKLLDSDWLRKECKVCNTSAKSVIPVQITYRNSGL